MPSPRPGSSRRPSRTAARRPSIEYDTPEAYMNLNDIYVEPPVQDPGEHMLRYDSHASRPSRTPSARETRMARRRSTTASVDYDVPDSYANLDEVASVFPVQNPDESALYRHHSLEEARSQEQEYQSEKRRHSLSNQRRPGAPAEGTPEIPPEETAEPTTRARVSRVATQVYTISYLVLFSFLGTLARLGLQALTYYPGAPLMSSSVWPNFAGSLFIGFLAEDRMLFRDEWGTPTYENQLRKAKQKARDEENGSGSGSGPDTPDLAAAKKAHAATKKTIPLYIGLATGFCGSFTSFSSFIRDIFLAMSNDLPNADAASPSSRNGGYSFMALLAVVIVTVSLSLAGLFIGAHIAIALEPLTPSLPYLFTRKFLDRFCVFLAWGCWVGAILLSILPPDRNDSGPETWRGRAVFALVFAPLGCLARFYASLYLNRRFASFPLGTFVVNVAGTAVLATAWVLAHVPLGGVVGCQVLQGVEDGFCGCLTTVSTWVAELAALRRRHAYVYGASSVLVALAFAVAIMGGLRWSDGFAPLLCIK